MSNLKSIFIVFIILASLKLNGSEPKKRTCNFTDAETHVCDYNVNPGDTVELICKYVKNSEDINEFANNLEDFKDKKYCFKYVNVNTGPQNSFIKIEDFALGVYGVKTAVSSDDVTTSTITFPPFIPKNIIFVCNCYKKEGEINFTHKVLNVSVSQSPNYKANGCNFNENKSIFPEFGKQSDYNKTKMCNIYNVTSPANLGILCPEGTTIEPEKCFTEVFTYKKWKYRENKQLKNEEIEKVNITKLTNGKQLINSAGDTNNKYATIPGNVNEKFLFFCRCKKSNGREEYRMNVYINLTEEQAKAKEVEEENKHGKDSEENNPNAESESENTENSTKEQSDKNSVSTDAKKSAASSNHMYVSSLVILFFTYILTVA